MCSGGSVEVGGVCGGVEGVDGVVLVDSCRENLAVGSCAAMVGRMVCELKHARLDGRAEVENAAAAGAQVGVEKARGADVRVRRHVVREDMRDAIAVVVFKVERVMEVRWSFTVSSSRSKLEVELLPRYLRATAACESVRPLLIVNLTFCLCILPGVRCQCVRFGKENCIRYCCRKITVILSRATTSDPTKHASTHPVRQDNLAAPKA
jgi:hypothetical protein